MRFNLHFLVCAAVVLALSACKDRGNPIDPPNGDKPPCPPIEIVPEPAYDSPVWHPSGQFIGFNHTPLLKIEYPYGKDCAGKQYFRGDSAGFWLINSDGTNKRRIFPYKLLNPAWSPDGEWIAFTVPIGSEAHIFKMRFTGTTFDTTTLMQLTFEGRNFSPAWSPDGQWIAYDNTVCGNAFEPPPPNSCGILVVRNDGTEKKLLMNARMPTWHPNGQSLLGVIGTSPTSIWKRFVRHYVFQTAQAETLSAVVGNDNRHPKYSPDGTKIAFWSSGNLWLMDTIGANLRELTTRGVGTGFGLPFSWSPSGNKTIYYNYRGNDWTMENGVLWLLDVNSGIETQLTFNP